MYRGFRRVLAAPLPHPAAAADSPFQLSSPLRKSDTAPPARAADGRPGAADRALRGLLRRVTPFVERFITDYLGWMPYTQLANITGRPP